MYPCPICLISQGIHVTQRVRNKTKTSLYAFRLMPSSLNGEIRRKKAFASVYHLHDLVNRASRVPNVPCFMLICHLILTVFVVGKESPDLTWLQRPKRKFGNRDWDLGSEKNTHIIHVHAVCCFGRGKWRGEIIQVDRFPAFPLRAYGSNHSAAPRYHARYENFASLLSLLGSVKVGRQLPFDIFICTYKSSCLAVELLVQVVGCPMLGCAFRPEFTADKSEE